MDNDEIEITVVPPGGVPKIYATVVTCPCEWKQDGLGIDEDSPSVPIGSIGCWFTLVQVNPACSDHAGLADR